MHHPLRASTAPTRRWTAEFHRASAASARRRGYDALYRIIGGREPLSPYQRAEHGDRAQGLAGVAEPVEADDGYTELPALHAAAAVMAATPASSPPRWRRRRRTSTRC